MPGAKRSTRTPRAAGGRRPADVVRAKSGTYIKLRRNVSQPGLDNRAESLATVSFLCRRFRRFRMLAWDAIQGPKVPPFCLVL
jgi:hypothetical protein